MLFDIQVFILNVSYLHFINWCYLAVNSTTKDAVFIDPAWEFDKFKNVIIDKQLNPKAVLLTHHHADHIDLAEKCAKFYGIPVFMHTKEIKTYNFTCENLQELPSTGLWNIASIPVNAIETPGHTVGGVCYLIGTNLFTGDTLFNEGCGICTCKGGSAETMFHSMQKLKENIPGTVKVYPGHVYDAPVGKMFESVIERNIYLHINDENTFVNYRMRANQDVRKSFNFK